MSFCKREVPFLWSLRSSTVLEPLPVAAPRSQCLNTQFLAYNQCSRPWGRCFSLLLWVLNLKVQLAPHFWHPSCSKLWHNFHEKKKYNYIYYPMTDHRVCLKMKPCLLLPWLREGARDFILKNRRSAHALTWDRSWPVRGSQEVMGAWECLVWRKRSERIWSCGNWTGNMESNPFLAWENVRERRKMKAGKVMHWESDLFPHWWLVRVSSAGTEEVKSCRFHLVH